MGIHLFVLRSWYFLFVAFVGTLHVTIPFAIATYYVFRDPHWFLILVFIPVIALSLGLLNVTAMRAVMRSYGAVGEPDTVAYMKAVIRNLTFDTLFPANISFALSLIVAWTIRKVSEGDPLTNLLLPQSDERVIAIRDALSVLPFDALLISAALMFFPFIYFVIVCLFGVTAASGAAMASARAPLHLPIHGFAQRFWYIAPTILCNATLISFLILVSGLGGVSFLALNESTPITMGFSVLFVLVCTLAYFNMPVCFALAYCDYEDERLAEEKLISEMRMNGLQEDDFDVRAMRISRNAAGDEFAAGE